jgi:hypothetical protein
VRSSLVECCSSDRAATGADPSAQAVLSTAINSSDCTLRSCQRGSDLSRADIGRCGRGSTRPYRMTMRETERPDRRVIRHVIGIHRGLCLQDRIPPKTSFRFNTMPSSLSLHAWRKKDQGAVFLIEVLIEPQPRCRSRQHVGQGCLAHRERIAAHVLVVEARSGRSPHMRLGQCG